MSDLTAELNLALAVDGDDTADYLVTTGGLRGSLNTIDGLFSSTTGHNHSGAHQGGNFTSLSLASNLTVGGNASITGTLTVLGASHLASLLLDTTLGVGGLATLQSLDVTTTSHLRGAVTLDAALTVAGTTALAGVTATSVAASGYLAAGPVLSAASGDLNANRNNGTGYVFLANATHYLGFDGSNYVLPSSALYVNSHRVVTEDEAETLSNKTLTSPTLNSPNMAGTVAGAPVWSSAQAFPANTSIGGDPVVRGYSGRSKVMTGLTSSGSVGNNTATPISVSFGYTFTSIPEVVVSLTDTSNRATTDLVGICHYNITTSGMTVEFLNRTGSTQSFFASWIAIGGA